MKKSTLVALFVALALTAQARESTLIHFYHAHTPGVYVPDPPPVGSVFSIRVVGIPRFGTIEVQHVSDGKTPLLGIVVGLYDQLQANPDLDGFLITLDPAVYTITLDAPHRFRVHNTFEFCHLVWELDTVTTWY